MEIMGHLCIYTIISKLCCPFLCSISSCNDPLCALTFSLCLVAIQNDHTYVHPYNNPNSALLPSHFQESSSKYGNSLEFPRYDVFLNHRGTDVKESIASLIFHNLQNRGFKVFLDKNSIQVGDNIPRSIEEAIHSASVHLVIFSINYAESIWCLKELQMIVKSGAPIIPIFYGVEPSELRMRDEKGVFSQAFQMHQHIRNFELQTLEEWKKALYQVSYLKGFIFTGDQGELLERIARNVMKLQSRPEKKGRNCPSYVVEEEDEWNDCRRRPYNA